MPYIFTSPTSRQGFGAVLLFSLFALGALQAAQGDATGRRMPVPPRLQLARWSDTSGGPAALGTLAAVYGQRVAPARLEQLAGAVGVKATLAGLQSGAQTLKLKTSITQVTADSLPAQPLPAIAEWSNGEFRVIVDAGSGGVEIFNPENNTRARTGASAMDGWTGRLLLVHPLSL